MSQSTPTAAAQNLSKSSLIELFFDLVFIFCLCQLIPVITNSPGDVVDLKTFATFTFAIVLLLQIWFDVTLFMNGFGTGSPLDVLFLIVNILLLIIMSQVVSPSWDLYYIYNACWILILLNCCIHWFVHYRMIKNPDDRLTHTVRRTLSVFCTQIVVIALSFCFDEMVSAFLCILALALGFFSWSGRDAQRMNLNRYHHLADRGSLLVVMIFGEMVILAGTYTGSLDHVVSGLLHVLTIVAMFLVYVIELDRALDVSKFKSGLWFMAVTTWQTLVAINYTAAFQLMVDQKNLWIMDSSLYFSLSLMVFLLSFFLYLPLNKPGRTPGKRWIFARVMVCLACSAASTVFMTSASNTLSKLGILPEVFSATYNFAPFISTATGIVLVLIVLVLDWRNYGKSPRNAQGIPAKFYGDFERAKKA